jgi:hypothetical protein
VTTGPVRVLLHVTNPTFSDRASRSRSSRAESWHHALLASACRSRGKLLRMSLPPERLRCEDSYQLADLEILLQGNGLTPKRKLANLEVHSHVISL